ncbi:MAG: FAD-dependent monooxygenase [Cystobacter sp.]
MSAEARSTRECEVLVVGAGPTGLMAATLLKRRGVEVRIIDERAEASRESRAFAIQARSLELFLGIGLADALLARGVVNTGIDFFVSGRRSGGLDLDAADSPDTPYQFIFMLPQSETEVLLIEELTRQGVRIERGIKVSGLEQDAHGVVTRGTTAEGGAFQARSAYVVGADGAHSIIRKSAGLTFEGRKYAQSFLLADCRVEWPLDHHRFRVFLNGETIGLFLPLRGSGLSRVMVTDPSGKADAGGTEAAPLELEEIQAAFVAASGQAVTLKDLTWGTRYRVHQRGVDRYRVGRVFVAGDAAHIHSPAGGQGMNTGLQDAANLAWKLAAVLRGGAEDGLLDTYDAERLPVGKQVLATTDRLFSAAAGKTGWEATVRDWIARPLSATISKLAPAQHRAFRMFSELDIAYEKGPFVAEGSVSEGRGGPAVGARAPNARIARHSDVFDLLGGYRFNVLALSRKALDREETKQLSARLGALGSGSNGIAAHLVTRVPAGKDPHAVFVESADVFDAYGLEGREAQALYVVRPDGYVCWRSDGLDIDACQRFLSRFGS